MPAIAVNARWVAVAHGVFAYAAFFAALAVGVFLHYEKIVQNASFGYPDEWFPSVSATIGDRYPERSVFQVLIAVTSGPRFLLLALVLAKQRLSSPKWAYVGSLAGVLRTFTCGGWVYITSTDDHDFHDIFMISYIVLTIPWTVITTVLSPKGSLVKKGRALTAIAFFATLVPLVYWFIQHKVHVRPGAYLIYAYFEWALILLDVGFDSWLVLDFEGLTILLDLGDAKTPEKTPVAPKKTEKSQAAVLSQDSGFSCPLVVDIANSFILWTIISSLLLCVWYFPLWYMGISGYEVTIVVCFVAPALLLVPPIRWVFTAYPSVARVLAVLFGLGAYKLDDPAEKLLSVTTGTGFGILALVSELYSAQNDHKRLHSHGIGLILGLVASSVAKFSYKSNNPVWPVMHAPNGGLNAWGIFLGLAAALLTRPSPATVTQKPLKGGSFMLAALGFGAYFFSIKSYLADSSTLALWTWDGYPVTGPTPVTGALFHYAAVGAGILAAVYLHPNNINRPFFHVLGGISAYVLYQFPGWLGYAGACGYVFYLSAVGSVLWQSTAGYNVAGFFAVAFFADIIISLASIWIVAYAFVPGGPLLRERTDIVLGASFALVVGGCWNYSLRNRASGITRIEINSRKLFSTVLVALLLLFAGAIAVFVHRLAPHIEPYNESSSSFTAGIWCVHFGLDNDMWLSEKRMADLLRDAQVDIIGLLESDTQRLIGGNRDFTQAIAEDLGMYADYGPGPNKHTWGAALLLKFPIVESSHHLLPSPVGELAPAILATLDIYGELVDVVVFHSGQEEDEEDRRLQSLAVRDLMGGSERPLVLLSYLVTDPLEGNYNTYVSDVSRVYDIDSTDWDRWCEYILFRGLKKVAYARISRSTITDTELQVAKFTLLGDYNADDTDFLYGNHFVDEQSIPEDLRMPQMFRGDGVRGHRYHVFDEPRYFALHQD